MNQWFDFCAFTARRAWVQALVRELTFCKLHQFSHSVVSDSLQPHELQHGRAPCPSPTPRVHSNSDPSSWWCHPAISSSVVPFSSCLQSFQALGSFPVSLFFASSGQSIWVSASSSVLPMNIQDWFPLGLAGLISLQPKGFSRFFSSTTVHKHQFFGVQPSLWSNLTYIPEKITTINLMKIHHFISILDWRKIIFLYGKHS